MTTHVHTINPLIAAQIGEAESILLNQIDYWLSKSGRHIDNLDGNWIYNSHQEWLKQFSYWSLSKLRRTIKSLETLGLIISAKINSKKWNQTKWYTIDYEKYAELFKTEYLKSSNSKPSMIKKEQSINKSDYLVDSLSSNTNYSNSSYFVENQITKVENTALKVNNKISKKESSISRDIKLNIHKNASQHAEVCICSKWTNQSVQNEQMLIVTKNNYTNTSSNEFKNNNLDSKEEEINSSNPLKESKAQQTTLTTNETKLVEQMVELWNKVFSCSINPIKAYASKSNRKTLLDVLNNHFAGDLSEWQEYAKKVNSSQFLMGETETKKNFKATFSWLIKPEIIEKIMNDEYGVGDRELDMNNLDKNIEQKKNEVVNKMDEKVSEFIKNNINETKERAEFKEYVRNTDHREEDKYGILKVMQHIPYQSLLEREEYKGIRENLYESYIMKKYVKHTKLETRKKLRLKLNEAIKDKGKTRYEVLQEMKYLETKITAMNMDNTSYKQIETMI